MYIGITGRHLELTPALREFTEQKVRKAQKYSRKITEALVTLSVEKYRHKAEIFMRINGSLLQATEESGEMYMSIDKAMDKMERQIKKFKEKRSDHKISKKTHLQDEGYLGVVDSLNKMHVERRSVELHSFTLEQALGKMEQEGADCLLFKNALSGHPNVLYLSKEKEVALLEPQL